MRCASANSASVIGPEGSVTPGATPHTRSVGASACASIVMAASSAAFDKRVRQVVRIGVPQLLVEQIHDAALRAARLKVRMQRLGQQQRCAGVGAQVLFERG